MNGKNLRQILKENSRKASENQVVIGDKQKKKIIKWAPFPATMQGYMPFIIKYIHD